MHQSERDWCNNSQARLLHGISFHVGRVSEWGVNWGSRWTSRCTGRSRATSLVPSLCLTLAVFLSALPHLSLLPPPVHRSGWEPGTNLPVHLIEQTWEPDTFRGKQGRHAGRQTTLASSNCEQRSWNSTNFSGGSDEHLCAWRGRSRACLGNAVCPRVIKHLFLKNKKKSLSSILAVTLDWKLWSRLYPLWVKWSATLRTGPMCSWRTWKPSGSVSTFITSIVL